MPTPRAAVSTTGAAISRRLGSVHSAVAGVLGFWRVLSFLWNGGTFHLGRYMVVLQYLWMETFPTIPCRGLSVYEITPLKAHAVWSTGS